MIILWIDSYIRGGLEKSTLQLASSLLRRGISERVILLTLENSIPRLKQDIALNYSHLKNGNVLVLSQRSHALAYLFILHSLRKGDIVVSLKNHLPLLLCLTILFAPTSKLYIRHSNTILAPLLAHSIRRTNQILSFIRGWVNLILSLMVYRLYPNHIVNSLENYVLIGAMTARKPFLFVSEAYVPNSPSVFFPSSKTNSINTTSVKSIKFFWRSRFSPEKDIYTLVQSINLLSEMAHSIPCTLDFHLCTSKASILQSLLDPSSLHSNILVTLSDWTPELPQYSNTANCITLHTSYYEGLSNSFVEAKFSGSDSCFHIVPLTSAGFLENLGPEVVLYEPGSALSLLRAMKSSIHAILTGKIPCQTHNYSSFNQIFFDSLNALTQST